ncbi:Rpn family recombination-promoting nuclease/putative transposase [uncultured Aliivibrio sp.]|uniref:Rpn family recombination-promoting nuclease/putative transposase n=1 Tax=uncultured Aliivibrio sp. TaxID=873085 RepID=UPI00262887D5|nr:Rpn family recombination-promoting nuclease/putative transposase [uncultured Aliivibrio sp.]
MTYLTDKYLNPFTDFGFKKLFGSEANKTILIDFLNTLLEGEESTIVDLTFISNEQLGKQIVDRRAVFDIYCENEKGEKFIVELQKSKQNFFKDRSVFYSSFPIQEQGQKGNWNFELKAIYTIAILDFVFDEDKEDKEKYFYKVKLSDVDTNKVFYDKLTFIYLEMPKFTKALADLTTHFERWMYVFKNLETLQDYPESLTEGVFKSFFAEAELAQLPLEKQREYENSLKYYRDLNNVIDTAFDDGKELGKAEGIELGKAEGILEVARNLLDVLDNHTIALKTGLSVEEIQKLR